MRQSYIIISELKIPYADKNVLYIKKSPTWGAAFFGGEMLFAAEIIYIQHIRQLCCETTLLTKPLKLQSYSSREASYVV